MVSLYQDRPVVYYYALVHQLLRLRNLSQQHWKDLDHPESTELYRERMIEKLYTTCERKCHQKLQRYRSPSAMAALIG
jgi:hypothetical protein